MFKNILLYPKAYIRQTKYIVMIVKAKVYQNYKFHNPGGKGSCARAWPYKTLN